MSDRRQNVGFRIRMNRPQADPAILNRLYRIAVPNLADAMHKFGVMAARIRPMWEPMPRIVGSALTVKALPGDTLLLRKAMEIARAGEIIVFDGQGYLGGAVWGGNASIDMVRKGVVGLVADAAVRDLEETEAVRFPVFAAGSIARMGTRAGPGEINYPISCGGVVIMPGDMVVADREGVAVIPLESVFDVVERAEDIQETKGSPSNVLERLEGTPAGSVHGLEAINAMLESLGCQIET